MKKLGIFLALFTTISLASCGSDIDNTKIALDYGYFLNGEISSPEDLEADIKACREKLYGPKCSELSNLEFCETTLKLREAIIKRDGIDPFLPRGANIKPTDYDTQRAQAVADVMAECIKEANGDSGVFTALLQAKTNNDSPALVAHLKKVGAIK